MTTSTSPAHGNHGIGHGGDQETKQGDWSGIAESLSQFARGARTLWIQVELLKGLARHGEKNTLRRLVFAEVVRVNPLGLVAGVGHGGWMNGWTGSGGSREGESSLEERGLGVRQATTWGELPGFMSLGPS